MRLRGMGASPMRVRLRPRTHGRGAHATLYSFQHDRRIRPAEAERRVQRGAQLRRPWFVRRELPNSVGEFAIGTAKEHEPFGQPYAGHTTARIIEQKHGVASADVVTIVEDYSRWLATSDVPKLFVNAEPGAILNGRIRDYVRTWANLTEVTVPGVHFIQEDSPDEIGLAVAEFVRRLRSG